MTDRPIYRPGETVHWKAVYRCTKGDRIENPDSSEPVSICAEIEDSRFFEQNFTLDDSGCLSGSFVIPKSVRLGECRMGVRFGVVFYYDFAFLIEEYRAPESLGEIVLTETPEDMGDVARGHVKASYYSGEPIRGAKVHLTIREDEDNFRFDSDLFGQPVAEADARRYRNRSDDAPPIEFDLVTDETGQASFSFASAINDENDLSYGLEAEITDPSGRVTQAYQSFPLSRHPVHVALLPLHPFYPEGGAVVLNLVATNAKFEKVALDGELIPALVCGEKDRSETRPTKPLDPVPVHIAADGTTVLSLPGLKSGEYEFHFRSDKTGEIAFADTSIIVGLPEHLYGESAEYLWIDWNWSPDGGLFDRVYALLNERSSLSFQPGDKVRVFVPGDAKVQSALFSACDWTLREAKVIPMNKGPQILEFTLDG
ncbi:MAG TPA: MG2 domain-containing protein, partial [Opitutales bacterium]|nr:MG2 domain-containing protein [Opitutales bacterium]